MKKNKDAVQRARLIQEHELAQKENTETLAAVNHTNNDIDNDQESTKEIRKNDKGLKNLFMKQLHIRQSII